MWINKDKYLEMKIQAENYKTARDYADELRHKLDIKRHELIMMRRGGEVSE